MSTENTCKSCTKYVYCWERSRDYPCRSYDNMYSPEKGGKEAGNEPENNKFYGKRNKR